MGKKFSGNRHVHGCRRCATRYEDTCTDTDQDALCTGCRGARVWQLLIDNASPKDCCTAASRLATKDERTSYRLAGARTWFICRTCARTHPYNPAKENQ